MTVRGKTTDSTNGSYDPHPGWASRVRLPDGHAARSEFGFVIDPDRHQQILNMGADQ